TTRNIVGKKFARSDNRGADWHRLIGLADVVERDRRFVALVVEGGKDAVAAAGLGHRAGLLCDVVIVAPPGAGYRPIPSELQQFYGRKVLLTGDRDAAGMKVIEIVSHALTEHGVDHAVWNWNSFDRRDGKDLFQLLSRKKENSRCSYDNFFLLFSPSNSSTVQQFNSSTNTLSIASGRGFNGSTNVCELVQPFIVKKRGTGNALSFQLARALRGYEATTNTMLDDADIDAVFREWFTKSQPLLPPDADTEKSLRHFYKQLRRVRFLTCALEAAKERARTLPL